MAKKKSNNDESIREVKMMRPAMTPEAREDQMIALAVDLAERQLREGTASSQVITHFLKLGTTREKMEKEMLDKQTQLVDAKIESLKAAQRVEEVYSKALEAMRVYSGSISDVEHEDL